MINCRDWCTEINHRNYWMCLSVFTLALGLVACTSTSSYENKIFEDIFSLDVESSMVDIGAHDPIASTEYGNDFKDFYFKVSHVSVEETRERPMLNNFSINDLHELSVSQGESLYEYSMSSPSIISSVDTVVNSMLCTIHEISTDGNGLPIRYKLAYFTSEKRLYQLHVWILEKRLDRFREGINRMIFSFKEL